MRFPSDLVGPGEGLIDFESEVALVVVAVSLAFDNYLTLYSRGSPFR